MRGILLVIVIATVCAVAFAGGPTRAQQTASPCAKNPAYCP